MKPTSITKIPDNLTEKEHREIAEKLSSLNIDGIELSDAGGRWGATWETQKNYNLDFLKFYKGIKTLRLYLPGVTDINPILYLAESLENLQLGEFNEKKISLTLLGKLSNLNYLSVVRNSNGLESIIDLTKLNELALTGYSIDKLPYLNKLENLKRLYIGFGTTKSLDNIGNLKNIEELDILWVKQLSDINAISHLTGLIKLKIEDEKQITSLPDLSKLKQLKNIRLMNLGTLTDISSLASSYVEEFILTGPVKNADVLKPILISKTVKKAFTYFYLKKEQVKAEHLLADKFCKLDKMNYDMFNGIGLLYYDIKTGKRIV
jgi:Leucine-rich repeat (LRR) protein